MEKSPFENGRELVSHIDSSKIEIDNSFDGLVRDVAMELRLKYNIEARLHKLVLYEEGEEVLIGIKIQKNQKESLVL